MKLYIASDDRAHAILVADEDHNDIAEFFHSDHATVSQSYETALGLARALVTASDHVCNTGDGEVCPVCGRMEMAKEFGSKAGHKRRDRILTHIAAGKLT
jgi:hypothetical protein